MTKTYSNALDLLTFSRASGGTSLRKISYGSELVTNGTFDSDSDWTKDAGWTISGGTANYTHATVFNSIYQTISTVAGKVYKLSLSCTDITSGTFQVFAKDTNDSGTLLGSSESVTAAGDYEFVFTAASTVTFFKLTAMTGAGTVAEFDNISVKEVLFDQPDGTLTLFNHPDNIPRIDYDADGTVKGLLIEEQRVNYIAISSGWNTSGTNISFGGYTTAPDGTNTASLFVTDATGNYNRGVGGITTSSTYTDIVYSVFVKKELARYATFKVNISSIDGRFWYDFDTGATGFSTHPTYINRSISAEDYPDGWKRITITLSNSNYTGYFGLGLASSDDQPYSTYNRNITGDGTQGAYFWGAQAEFGSFSTSYIPTSGATATRSADIASIPVTDFGYNQGVGSLVVDANPIPVGSGYGSKTLVNINDGGANSEIGLLNDDDDRLRLILDPEATTNDVDIIISGAEGNNLYSAGWKLNSTNAAHGGILGTEDTANIPIKNATQMTLSSSASGAGKFSGHIKSIQYFPRRLSNQQLVDLTS